jgi:hypothetical protein
MEKSSMQAPKWSLEPPVGDSEPAEFADVFASFTPGRERGRLPGEGREEEIAFEKGRYLVHNELLVGRMEY